MRQAGDGFPDFDKIISMYARSMTVRAIRGRSSPRFR